MEKREREREGGRETDTVQEGVWVERKRVEKGRRAARDVRRSERRCPAKEERDEKEKAESITI